MVIILWLSMFSVIIFVTVSITELEESGARSRLDAVLKGLVEKSEHEKLVRL